MSWVEYSPAYAHYGLDQVTGLQRTDGSAVTDTFWPMLLGETGVIGMIAFGAFIGLLLVELWKAAGRAEDLRSRAFALGALMFFVETLIGSSTSATYVAPPSAYFLFSAVGASLAVSAWRP
jgi:O-antigen ligase